MAICALGLLVSIWSRRALGNEWSGDVELKQGHKLVERGPYAFVRHPIYTAPPDGPGGAAIGSGRLVAFAGMNGLVPGRPCYYPATLAKRFEDVVRPVLQQRCGSALARRP